MRIERAESAGKAVGSLRGKPSGSKWKAVLALVALIPVGIVSGCAGVASGTGTNPNPTPQASLQVTPASFDFGSTTVGKKVSKTATVTNTGNVSVTVSQATLSSAQFAVSGMTLPMALPPSQSANFTVWFNSTSAGQASGTLTLQTDAGVSAAPVTLTATATAVAAGQLTLSASSLSFSSVGVGSNATLPVTVTNSSQTAVNISQINVSGTGYTATGIAVPTTLNPGGAGTLQVQFTPSATGAANGSVSIVSDGTGSPQVIALSGTGVQAGLTITPASVSFGNVVVGATNSQTLQFKNTGNTTLTVSQAVVSGTGFSTSGLTLPLVLTAGQTKNFNVQFAPLSASPVSGGISVVSDAPNSPANIALSGTGVAATLTLSVNPSSLSFGSVNTGASSSKTVTITNTGNSSVAISQIAVVGAGVSVTGGNAPLTLSPSQSVTLTVQYAPTTAGTLAGTITVTSNATGSPTVVTLSGAGVTPVQHTVTLNWGASSSTVNGYNVYRSTVSGGSYAIVNSSIVGGLTFDDGSVQGGTTYFYVTTAVDGTGNESVFSNEVPAVIP